MARTVGLEPGRPAGYIQPMSEASRKLAGTLLLVAFIIVYVLLAMVVAAAVLPRAGGVLQFIYYAVAGLAWVPPAGWIISWMHRNSGGKSSAG